VRRLRTNAPNASVESTTGEAGMGKGVIFLAIKFLQYKKL
jgi:hypothetical protein